MDKQILLIVEGPRDEKVLVEKIFDRFDRDAKYRVIPYSTSIHALIKSLFRDGIDEDVDIVRLLKSSDVPEDRRIGKDERFTDVYLVFDMDPHDSQIDVSMLRALLEFFDDSTDHGKMFLNYPMMQSYRHITGVDDEDFRDRVVPAGIGRRYKALVDEQACNRLKQINRLDRKSLKWLITMHLCKMNRVVNGKYEMPTREEYMGIKGWMVLDRQVGRIEKDGMIYVLNTSIFFIVDYNPAWFLADEAALRTGILPDFCLHFRMMRADLKRHGPVALLRPSIRFRRRITDMMPSTGLRAWRHAKRGTVSVWLICNPTSAH